MSDQQDAPDIPIPEEPSSPKDQPSPGGPDGFPHQGVAGLQGGSESQYVDIMPTHYGYPWDSTPDSNTRKRKGAWENLLQAQSVALAPDVAHKLGAKPGDEVAVPMPDGRVLTGYYDDRIPAGSVIHGKYVDESGRVDFYDPNGQLENLPSKAKVRLTGKRRELVAWSPQGAVASAKAPQAVSWLPGDAHQSPLDRIRSNFPQYDDKSDAELISLYKAAKYPDADDEEFARLMRTPGVDQAMLEQADEKKLPPLGRFRRRFPQYSPDKVSDDALIHKLYTAKVGVKGNETLDQFRDRVLPPNDWQHWLGSIWKDWSTQWGPNLSAAWHDTLANFEVLPRSEGEIEAWLQKQPWYAAVNPADYWSTKARDAINPAGFRDRVAELYRRAQENAKQAQQTLQQAPQPEGLAGHIGAAAGQFVGQAPYAAASFALEAANPLASLMFGTTLETLSAEGRAEDAKQETRFGDAFQAGGTRAVQGLLMNTVKGRVASGFAQVAIAEANQVVDWLRGKPGNSIDQHVAQDAVALTLGVLFGQSKNLPKSAVEELEQAHEAMDAGDVAKAEEHANTILALLPAPQRQEVARAIQTQVDEMSRGHAVEEHPEGQKQPAPQEPTPKPSPKRRRIRKAYQSVAKETQALVEQDPEYRATLEEQEELSKSFEGHPEVQKLVAQDEHYQNVRREYERLSEEMQRPYVPISELHKRVGGSLEDLHEELRRMSREGELAASVGEPLFAPEEQQAAALEMEGEKFLHVRLAEPKEPSPGLYFYSGIPNPLHALKQLSYLAELAKPLRAAVNYLGEKTGYNAYRDAVHLPHFNPGRISEIAAKGEAAIKYANARNANLAEAIPSAEARAMLNAMGLLDKLGRMTQSIRRDNYWKKFKDEDLAKILNSIETGQRYANKMVDDMSTLLRAQFRMVRDFDRLHGINNYEARANYIPHIFKNEAERQRYVRYFHNRWGNPDFVNSRTFDTIWQAHQAGFKMATYNPERLFQMRWAASRMAAAKIDALRLMAEAKVAYLKPEGESVPKALEAWQQIRSPNGEMYLVHPDVMPALKNAYDPASIYRTPFGPWVKALKTLKGLTVPWKLSWSLYHGFHVAQIRAADALTTAFERSLQTGGGNKGFIKAFHSALTQGVSTTVGDIHRYGGVVDFVAGKDVQLTPEQIRQLNYANEAGLVLKPSHERELEWFRAVNRNFKMPESGADAADQAAAFGYKLASGQYVSRFIFGKAVPAAKLSALMDRVQTLLREHPELETNRVERLKYLSQFGRDIEGRYGEMHYDNLLWNKMYKDIGISMLLSLGWQLGFFRVYAGAFKDLTHNLAHMDEIAQTFRQAGLRPAAKQFFTNKILYASFYSGLGALMSGVMTYLATKTIPHGMDYLFPRIGKNPDGSDKRLNTFNYLREFASLNQHVQSQGLVAGVSDFAKNKLQPVAGDAIDLLRDVNYMGQEIYSKNPKDPILQKIWDGAQYVFGNSFIPITANQYGQPGTSWRDHLLSFFGFSPGPAYASRSERENEIINSYRRYNSGVRPRELEERMNLARTLRQAIANHDQATATQAYGQLRKLGMSDQQLKFAVKNADVPLAKKLFGRLPPDEQARFLREMPRDEAAQYWDFATRGAKQLYLQEYGHER